MTIPDNNVKMFVICMPYKFVCHTNLYAIQMTNIYTGKKKTEVTKEL